MKSNLYLEFVCREGEEGRRIFISWDLQAMESGWCLCMFILKLQRALSHNISAKMREQMNKEHNLTYLGIFIPPSTGEVIFLETDHSQKSPCNFDTSSSQQS